MKAPFGSNCHTHTLFCDGKASIEEMIKAAIGEGFVSLGFSGHSPLPYENDWAMKEEDLPLYLKTLAEMKEKYQNEIEIVTGIELDADSEIDLSPFAYTLGSLHTLHKDGCSFPVDADKALLRQCCDELFDGNFHALMRYYYEKLYEYVKRQPFTVLGHFDLPLKYNKNGEFINENDSSYQKMALEALDGILDLRPDLIVEINTGGIPRAGRPYPYPAPFLLRRLKQRNARMTLTADAHSPSGIAAAYRETAELLNSIGILCLYRLEKGVFAEFHLSNHE